MACEILVPQPGIELRPPALGAHSLNHWFSRQVVSNSWDPMDCSLPGSSVHGIFQVIVLEWIAISFSRGIFPTQGSNPGLLHCRWILYRLSHQGSPTGHEFEETPGDSEGQRSLASCSAVYGVAKSRRRLSDWTTTNLLKKKMII